MRNADGSPLPFDPGAIDATLVEAYRAGDRGALSELYQMHYPMAQRLAERECGNQRLAEDLASEAFVKVMEAIRIGKGPTDSFSLYLRTVVRRLAWEENRNRMRVEYTDDLESFVTEHEQDTVDDLEEQMRDAFMQLPDRWRLVLQQRVLDGLRPAESAKAIGISASAEAQLFQRARAALKRAMSGAAPRRHKAR